MSRPRFPRSDHCDGTRFFNPRHHIDRGFGDVWRWKRTSRPATWPQRVPLDTATIPDAPRDGTVTATWIGHATVVCELPGGAARIPCGGTHVDSLGDIAAITVAFELTAVEGGSQLVMTTTATPRGGTPAAPADESWR